MQQPLLTTAEMSRQSKDAANKEPPSYWRSRTYVILTFVLNAAAIIFGSLLFSCLRTDTCTTGIKGILITCEYGMRILCGLEVVIKLKSMGLWQNRKTLNHDLFEIVLLLMDTLAVITLTDSAVVFTCRMLRVGMFTRGFTVDEWVKRKRIDRKTGALEFDEMGRILKYNPSKLFDSGYIFNLAGTVFAAPEVWLQFVVLSFVGTLYALNLCNVDCSHAFISALDAAGDADCEASCFAYIGVNNGLIFASVVSFLLGFFNNNTYTRWWAVRDKLGVVIGRSCNIAVVLGAYVPGQSEPARKARKLFMRYINLAHGFVYKQAAGDTDFSDLVAKELLTEKEWNLLRDLPSKYMMAYFWAANVLTKADKEGLVLHPVTSLPMIQGDISSMRGAAADVFMYLNCQVPYSYAHIVTWMTKIHLLLVAITGGSFVGAGFQRGFFSDYIWGYLLIFINAVIYNGLLHVHHVLLNPLTGDGSCDFPQEAYLDYCVHAGNKVLEQIDRLPFADMNFRDGEEADSFQQLSLEDIKTKDALALAEEDSKQAE